MQQSEFGFPAGRQCDSFADGAWWLRGFALPHVDELLIAIATVTERAAFRHMLTPGGHRMSAAMSNCGALGWVTDRAGYRYQPNDPATGQPWPAMPKVFAELAGRAAARAGYADFEADACLINRYQPGSEMGLHTDKDERDFAAPIVSVSLGLPMVFRFGGLQRKGPTMKLPLVHGDVLVWGGPSRRCYHAVSPLADGEHELLGRCRINLTFRLAG